MTKKQYVRPIIVLLKSAGKPLMAGSTEGGVFTSDESLAKGVTLDADDDDEETYAADGKADFFDKPIRYNLWDNGYE